MAAERSLNDSYRNFTAANKRKHLPTGRWPIEVVEDFKAWLFLREINEHKKFWTTKGRRSLLADASGQRQIGRYQSLPDE